MADYRDAVSGPADVPELAPAPAGGPAGRPGEGSPARDAGALVPAQDACRRLIARVGAGAGATSWMAHGACHRSDPELFFPIAATGTAAEQIQTIYARTVCGRCEVGKECLSYALRTMPDGIWGGTTREERIGLRARPAARSPRQAVTGASRTATPGSDISEQGREVAPRAERPDANKETVAAERVRLGTEAAAAGD